MSRSCEYKDQILAATETAKAPERTKTIQQRKNEGTEWESVWRTVANCNKKTLSVILLEDDALSYKFSL